MKKNIKRIMKKYVLVIWSFLLVFGCIAIFHQFSLAYLRTFGEDKAFYKLFTMTLERTRTSIRKTNHTLQTNLKWITDSMKANGREKLVLWKRDEKCKKFDVRFGKRFKFQFLASFPGSGNTWTRYLIEAATGIFTGSVFNDNTLFKLGFLGEREKIESGKMIVIKTHGSIWSTSSDLHNTSVPVVLVIRHVEKASLSYWHYKWKHSHLRGASKSSFETKGFRNHASSVPEIWRRVNEECLKTCKKVFVVFYENLKRDVVAGVKNIVNFLGFEPDPKRLECLHKYSVGPARREADDMDDPFHPDEKLKMIREMKIILELLERRKIKAPDQYYSYVHNNVTHNKINS